MVFESAKLKTLAYYTKVKIEEKSFIILDPHQQNVFFSNFVLTSRFQKVPNFIPFFSDQIFDRPIS